MAKKTVGTILALCMLALQLGAIPVLAEEAYETVYEEAYDNCNVTLDSNGTLTLSGTGDIPSFSIPWEYQYDFVKKIVIEEGLTSIPSVLFGNYTSVVEVSLPNTMQSIGSNAFLACTGLKSINLPDDISSIEAAAFQGCSSLTEIALPNKVTEIENLTFNGCESLESVTLSDNITSIDSSAFRDCKKLKTITIPAAVSFIADGAFFGCTALEEIIVSPDNDAYLSEDGILYEHNNGKKTALIAYPPAKPDKTYKLDNDVDIGVDTGYAFAYCCNLESIEGNNYYTSVDGVLYAGEYLIAYPAGKTEDEYIIPDGVECISTGAFAGNKNLKRVSGGANITEIENDAFRDSQSLETVALSDNINSIGSYAFEHCKKLKNINIPSSVTHLYAETFAYCSSLEAITIPEGVTDITANTFMYCTSLKEVTIPSTATDAGYYAFINCPSLSRFIVRGVNTTIDKTFDSIPAPDFTVYAHTSSKAKTCADNKSYNFVSICEDTDGDGKCDICDSDDVGLPILALNGTTVTVNNIEDNCTLVLASYKAYYNAGRLIDCKVIPITPEAKHSYSFEEMANFAYDNFTVYKIKAFLWKDLSSLTPLCDPVSYNEEIIRATY